VSIDPLIADLGDPQSHNPYSYVINNPVNLVDPTGMSFSGVEPILTDPAEFETISSPGEPGPEESHRSAGSMIREVADLIRFMALLDYLIEREEAEIARLDREISEVDFHISLNEKEIAANAARIASRTASDLFRLGRIGRVIADFLAGLVNMREKQALEDNLARRERLIAEREQSTSRIETLKKDRLVVDKRADDLVRQLRQLRGEDTFPPGDAL
jgi:hypothetical protein